MNDSKQFEYPGHTQDDRFKVVAFSEIFSALQKYSFSSDTVVFGSLAEKFRRFQENPAVLNANPYSAGDVDVCVILTNKDNHLCDEDTQKLVINPLIRIAQAHYGLFDPFFLVKTASAKLDPYGHQKTIDTLLVRNAYSTGVQHAQKQREILKSIRSNGVQLHEFIDTYWSAISQKETERPHFKKQKIT